MTDDNLRQFVVSIGGGSALIWLFVWAYLKQPKPRPFWPWQKAPEPVLTEEERIAKEEGIARAEGFGERIGIRIGLGIRRLGKWGGLLLLVWIGLSLMRFFWENPLF